MPNDPFYASAAWIALRRDVLRGARCAVPGCPKRPTHADHIRNRRAYPALALDRSNLQPLCHEHHSSKTRQGDADVTLRVRGCDPDGNPIDPRHRWNTKR